MKETGLDLGRQCESCGGEFDEDEGAEVDGLWKCWGCIK